jgi:uncharacterized OB-fold protein
MTDPRAPKTASPAGPALELDPPIVPTSRVDCPVRLDYTIAAGREQSRFLSAIERGRLLGRRCPECTKVYLPPRGVCPRCGVMTAEDVEVHARGTVTTWCVTNVPYEGQTLELPYVTASVLLDGADLPFYFLIQGLPADQMRMGMRVVGVWADTLGPSLDSLRYFKPSGEPDVPLDAIREHL